MEIIVFEKETYYKMQRELLLWFKKALREAKEEAEAKNDPSKDWISPEEAKKLLGVRSKTKMQQLRDTDAIRFSKYGRKIKYSKKSILEFLNKNIQQF